MAIEQACGLYAGTFNPSPIFAFSSIASNNYVYTLLQITKQEDIQDFADAIFKEIDVHVKRKYFRMWIKDTFIDKLYQERKILKTTQYIWSFKMKMKPDGSVEKHKEKIFTHGGMQIYGVDFWEIYAPVVNWVSVRILLTIDIGNKLPSR